jgi:hypothetical protein
MDPGHNNHTITAAGIRTGARSSSAGLLEAHERMSSHLAARPIDFWLARSSVVSSVRARATTPGRRGLGWV